MLQFIYGRAATGKSYTVLQKIKSDIEKGKSVVLLVPEQFTFESERMLLHTLSDGSSTDVSVLSFTRLYDEICRRTGGRTADVITDFDRVLLVFRAINAVSDNLRLWGRYKKSPRFAATLAQTITELKTADISPDELKAAGLSVEDKYLADKINDLSLIFAAYNALLGNSFLDPADSITRLADKLLDYKYFENKTVYIDAFNNFTGQQYKILERILSQADDVICSFTADELESDKNDTFYNIRKIAKKIKKLGEKYNCKLDKSLQLSIHHYKNEELSAVEKALLNIEGTYNLPTENIAICKCDTAFDEAKFAAQTIRRLVRENNYRYKDFVIICRDADTYQKAVDSACRDNKVFCFYDKRKNITYLPLTMFITALLELSVSFTTDNILNLLKTGLSPLSAAQVIELSNYIYLWNLTGKEWKNNWDMNPKEFGAVKEYYKDKAVIQLVGINTARQSALNLINEFLSNFNGTPSQMVTAIINCLNKNGVAEKLRENSDKLTNEGLLTQADDNRQCWDIIMQIFDGIVRCLPDKEININEFIDAWKMAVGFATIGNIPQMLDEVTFGSADRIKPSRPKVAFILGLNQNVFPKAVSSGGIFADSERAKLIDNGLEIGNTALADVVFEDYLVYTSLCCPTERLYMSYSIQDMSSKAAEPSAVISNILSAIPNIKFYCYPEQGLREFLPETVKTAEEKMCSEYSQNIIASNTLQYALSGVTDISVDNYIRAADKSNIKVRQESIAKLFGKNVYLSATQFDTYHSCRFAYFCKYALRLRRVQPAGFDAMQRGTIVHYVMQRFIEEHKDDMCDLDRRKCDELSEQYINEYLDAIPGYNNIKTPRLEFLVSKIRLIVKDVVYHIACEFAQSKFKPEFCELEIGADKTVESAPIVLSNDATFSIIGSIDRVDKWKGYIRVIDYKTGGKSFKLPDILLGLNMQMLIYLYSVLRCKNESFNSLLPAGVLYMPAVRENSDKTMRMNGIILDDEDVLLAMEKENAGEFVPERVLTSKGDTKDESFVSSELFETLFDYIETLIKKMGENIYEGNFGANPTDRIDSDACKYCDYYSVCCMEGAEHNKAKKMKNADVLIKIKEVQ